MTLSPFAQATEIVRGGRRGLRAAIGLVAGGCAYALRGKGPCTNCGFSQVSTGGAPVDPTSLMEQFETALARLTMDIRAALPGRRILELDIYNSGSFFNHEEVPIKAQLGILRRAGQLDGLEYVMVESRPEYVVDAVVKSAVAAVAPKQLEIGIGLESADRRVREGLVRKGFGLEEYEAALGVMARHRADLLAYLLLKPMGLGEREAIEDYVASAKYVFDSARRLGVRARVSMQPVFVVRGTPLGVLYDSGKYRPPWLWSVAECVKRSAGLGPVRVCSGDDFPPPYARRRNCGQCDASFESAIDRYNKTGDVSVFDTLDCGCVEQWRGESAVPAGERG
ncbi:MAG: hypothetical protein RDV41_14665 [Planctomycetota bacterium]|nr:hypothetical protein [Planctomycetota bacterium]